LRKHESKTTRSPSYLPQFLQGEGYSEDFIRNIYSVIGKEDIEIVKGPDDVCARCPYLKDANVIIRNTLRKLYGIRTGRP